MKILLFAVINKYYQNNCEFLGFELLASNLMSNGFECEIYPYIYDKNDEENRVAIAQVCKDINWLDVLFVGFSPFFNTFDIINTIIPNIKKENPLTKIVLGGAAVSHAIKQTMEYVRYADIIIVGEGEETIVDLARRLKEKTSLADCAGIAFRSQNDITVTPPRMLIENLNALPWARRDMLKWYVPQFARLQTSRGCEGSCTFCAESRIFELNHKKVWRGRTASNIIDEMEFIIETFGINTFSFVDESFEDPISSYGLERLEGFADEILRRGLSVNFDCLMRSENVMKIPDGIWNKIKQAGLISVLLGIESGSPETLALYGKYASVEDNYNAYTYLYHQLGINVIAGFIMFNPYTTLDQLTENVNFISELNIAYSMRVFIHQINLFYDTPLYYRVERDGLLQIDFGLTNPYGYYFQNEDVREINAILNEQFNVINKKVNPIYTVDYLHQIHENVLKYSSNLLDEERLKFVKTINLVKNYLGEIHMIWFKRILSRETYYDDINEELIKRHKKAIKECNIVQRSLVIINMKNSKSKGEAVSGERSI